VAFDAEIRFNGEKGERGIRGHRAWGMEYRVKEAQFNWLMAKAIPNKRPDH